MENNEKKKERRELVLVFLAIGALVLMIAGACMLSNEQVHAKEQKQNYSYADFYETEFVYNLKPEDIESLDSVAFDTIDKKLVYMGQEQYSGAMDKTATVTA